MIPICVALDAREPGRNLELARAVAEHVGHLKIGLTSFTSGGAALATDLAAMKPLFVDLKLHDIPAQVEKAVANVEAVGASLTTVHAAGGEAMVKAAVAAASSKLKVIAVTVLTSLDAAALDAIGIGGPPSEAVLRLADLALRAGADGLVCSPLEVASLRERFGSEPFLVVPGIRPEGSSNDDQRRTLGPREALDAGADLLVVGRPITGAADPAAAAAAIGAQLEPENEGGSGGEAKLASGPPEKR